jgi:hypothetical protein
LISKTFQGHLYTFTAVDSSTGFTFAKLAKPCLSVVDNLQALRLCVATSNKTFRFIQTDNVLFTNLFETWAKTQNIQNIQYQSLQEMIVKALANKGHLTS